MASLAKKEEEDEHSLSQTTRYQSCVDVNNAYTALALYTNWIKYYNFFCKDQEWRYKRYFSTKNTNVLILLSTATSPHTHSFCLGQTAPAPPPPPLSVSLSQSPSRSSFFTVWYAHFHPSIHLSDAVLRLPGVIETSYTEIISLHCNTSTREQCQNLQENLR